AMPRYVFDDRKHAAIEEAGHVGTREPDHPLRRRIISAVADDIAAPRLWHIEHRKTVDGYADVEQILRHEPADAPRRPEARDRITLGKLAKTAGRWVFAPRIGRWAQPLNPAALLIDQHRRVAPSDRFAKARGQGPDLVGCFAIAFEEYETPGSAFFKEPQFGIVQNGSGAA